MIWTIVTMCVSGMKNYHFNFVNQGERKIGMPYIIYRMRMKGEKVGIYPISEHAWLDMGQLDTMESMERKIKEFNLD